MKYDLIHSDCLEALKKMPDCYFDGVPILLIHFPLWAEMEGGETGDFHG